MCDARHRGMSSSYPFLLSTQVTLSMQLIWIERTLDVRSNSIFCKDPVGVANIDRDAASAPMPSPLGKILGGRGIGAFESTFKVHSNYSDPRTVRCAAVERPRPECSFWLCPARENMRASDSES